MVKLPEEKQNAKVDRFLASLTHESEFFGLIGEGYPNSLYKVYVRSTRSSARWWKFEVEARPVKRNPIKHQANVSVSARGTAIWAPLPHLVHFQYHPDKGSIAKLLARATELREQKA